MMENNVIFQFNNVDKPYLLLKYFDGKKINKLGFLEFKKNDLVDNLPIYEDLVYEIDRFLSSKNVERTNVIFIINCCETTKITSTVPNISERKIKKIYDADLANKIDNLDNYERVSTVNDSNKEKIYYEILTEKRYREYFESFGKELGFQNIAIDNFATYLFDKVKNIIDRKTFAYFYEEKDVVSLVVSINGVLSAYHSFISSDENYRLAVVSIIDNHIYNLEKADLSIIAANTNIECLEGMNIYIKQYTIGA